MTLLQKAMWEKSATTLALWLLALLVAASIGVLFTAKPAHADTFTVNRTGDASDLNTGDGRCDTSSTNGRQCTLRAAIEESNANDNEATVVDLIRFEIVSTDSVKTIRPTRALPTITEALTIDGYTQPDASPNTLAVGNDAVLKVQLNGIDAGGVNGLVIQAPDTTIQGLVINRFEGNGVLLSGSGAMGNNVEGNFIGTNAAGTAPRGNGDDGVDVFGASNNTIGGTTAGARNVISGNGGDGVQIVGGLGTAGNQILGNYIGTDRSGTNDLGNSEAGVLVFSVRDSTVGGTADGARNVISGNGTDGVQISGNASIGVATGNEVLGNFIGTNATGNTALGNSGEGVEISQAEDNTIGGTVAAARNIISGNSGDGVVIFGSDATGNAVQGNFIGTGANGTTALGNDDGVAISSGNDSTIGSAIGSTAGGNRIAHNDQDGVLVFGGLAVGNSVLSNRIFSNGETGIDLGGGTENTFGVTANDTDDPDATSPPSNNHRQNFPVITSAARSAITGTTIISGRLNSNPNQTYTIQCFEAAPDPSGFGEGHTLVGEDTVQTDAGGDASGTDGFSCSSKIPEAGDVVTATATNTSATPASGTSFGDTSEFSRNVRVGVVF